jgi:hypothetical protein
MFSKTSEKAVKKDICLKLEIAHLSPFLNTGFTIENFNLFGKIPDAQYLIHVYVKGELIKGVLYFKILTDISSYP